MTEFESIAWIDIETNGLNPDGSKVLQIACIMTDSKLQEVDNYYEAKVFYTEDEVAELYSKAHPFVQEMHNETKLWKALTSHGKPLEQVDEELVAYISEYAPEARTAWMGGSSMTLDRNFLEVYLPKTYQHLHYRSIDATTVAGFTEVICGKEVVVEEIEGDKHEALYDIRASIALVRASSVAFGVSL